MDRTVVVPPPGGGPHRTGADVVSSENPSPTEGRAGDPPDTEGVVEPLRGGWLRAAQIGLVVVVVAGVVLRVLTRSALWLDEALTVDIARLPLHEIPSYLKRDGAPPLFYVLLHFWMKVFGDSDVAVRSLSGVLSVATLPFAFVAGRRFGGRWVGWTTLLLLASAPFAVYYGTEARMYSLVMFLTACGFVAVSRVLEKPRPGNLIALAVVAAALFYSQYWSIYLVGSLGLWLLFEAWRGRPEWRSPARWAIGSLVVGVVLFLPWVPTFVYQAKYTGTPWAKPPNFAAVINAITGFTDNQATLTTAGSNQGRLLALGYFVLAGLAVFGIARGRWHIDLDVRTRFPGRILAFVVVVTLFAAITGGIVTGSAYSTRYASVVFVPLLVLVAFGSLALADAKLRLAVLAVLALAGLAASVENLWTQRTQAPAVAQAIEANARPGDIVAFCPDQLGPAVYRLMESGQTDLSGSTGRYQMITYPRGIGPAFVDWVKYNDVAEASNPAAFASRLQRLAGSQHDIWLVSAPGYIGFGAKCDELAADLEHAPGYSARQWVATDPNRYYEPMGLTQFSPPEGGTEPSGT